MFEALERWRHDAELLGDAYRLILALAPAECQVRCMARDLELAR